MILSMTFESLGLFPRFKAAILDLPPEGELTREQLLSDDFAVAQSGRFEVFYAPFDYVNPNARIMIVGVTPGWTQMEAAFVEARAALASGSSDEEALKRVKRAAAFAGSIRTNLVSMLDDIGVATALGISSTSELFGVQEEHLLQATSMLRYPIFNEGKNYSGTPPVSSAPLLVEQLNSFRTELSVVGSALIVPLGKSVTAVMSDLVKAGLLDARRCLFGLPHPSGANAHRPKQFADNRKLLSTAVEQWSQSDDTPH